MLGVLRIEVAYLVTRGSGAMAPKIEELIKHAGEFQVRDDADALWDVKWQGEPHIPNRNKNGVGGWALRDGALIRLHVCANNPCPARYPASKYLPFPPPHHVRLVEPETVAAAAADGRGTYRRQKTLIT